VYHPRIARGIDCGKTIVSPKAGIEPPSCDHDAMSTPKLIV
jgi:hypothetical protein